MTDLRGRVALVTGGTKGIGKAIVVDLLEVGFRVAFSARSEPEVRSTEAELSQSWPGQVLGIPSDVRDPQACELLVERVAGEFEGLDLLVNNAGVGRFAPIQEMSLEDWRVQIDTKLSGVFYLARAAIPYLQASDDAWIINIGSLAGRNTFSGGAAYNASKFGLLGLTEAMMLDLRYEGIRVSHIKSIECLSAPAHPDVDQNGIRAFVPGDQTTVPIAIHHIGNRLTIQSIQVGLH